MERRLSVILAADVVGYSRLMEADEERTVNLLNSCRQTIDALINNHFGRVFGSAGDSVIAEFSSPVKAVRCAIKIQQKIETSNINLPANQQMRFRIGINLGDVIVDKENLLGDGVNVAARLEATATPGGICISASVHQQVENKIEIKFIDSGQQNLKNISKPVSIYHWTPDGNISEPKERGIAKQNNRQKSSVAVLPFSNLSGNQNLDIFCDGVTEEIITALSRSRWLSVTARNSTFAYKGKSYDVRDVAQELRVDYVLEGSIRKSGETLRIVTQFIDGATGEHTWAETFDRSHQNEFAIQDEIAKRISSNLVERMWQEAAKNVTRKPPEDYNALDFVVLGLPLVHHIDPQEIDKAIQILSKALEIDDKIALGHLGMGFCYLLKFMHWDDPHGDAPEKAWEHAQKMQEIAPEDANTYRLLSRVMITKDMFSEAAEYAERALKINPHDGDIIGNKGVVLMFSGELDGSIQWFDRVLELHADTPHTVDIMMYWKALVSFMSTDYKIAIKTLSSVSGLNYIKSVLLGACYAMLDDKENTAKMAEIILKLRPNLSVTDIGLVDSFSQQKHRQHFRKALKLLGLPA